METTPQRSKHLAMMFLLGALLVGGALGFTVDRLMVNDRICPPLGDLRAMRGRLAADLSLSEAQRVWFDSILDRRNEVFDSIARPVKPQMDSVRRAARAEIRRRLEPAQQARWDEHLRDLAARDSVDKQRRSRP
jgi:hypothetical protein